MGTRLTVIGGGNGALAVAGDLANRGYAVTLFEFPEFSASIEPVMETGTIRLEGIGPVGEVALSTVTTDLAKALDGADIILPVTPAYAQERVAQALVPHIGPGTKIILTPGSTGGSFVFARVFREAGKFDGVKLAEMHTLPFAARKIGGNAVRLLLRCGLMFFAAFPATDNHEMYELAKPLFPAIELCHDVLDCGLNNGNAVSHPAPVVLNAGKIEFYGKHYHYREGITPSVARVNERIDAERMAIAAALGYRTVDACERLWRMGYCPQRGSLYECYQASTDIFLDLEGPNDLSGRYLTEDTPCSLVAMAAVAKVVGVPTPVMDSVITLASVLREENYWETGRTLNAMGLEAHTAQDLVRLAQYGF